MSKNKHLTAEDGKRLKAALKRLMARPDEGNKTGYDKVAESLYRNALLGKEASIAMIFERLEGKVPSDSHHEINSNIRFETITLKAVYPKQIDATVIDAEEPE